MENASITHLSTADAASDQFAVAIPFMQPLSLNAKQQLRKAVLLAISADATRPLQDTLPLISSAEWKHLLHWLDVSGLALHFYECTNRNGLCEAIPSAITTRLQQNYAQNSQRTRGMIAESVTIQREFQRAGITYAVMKGVSLCPDAIASPELRHQFDLDYLLAESSAPHARRILQQRGYHLRAVSDSTWEFKINEDPRVSIRDLYKDLPYRGVELHLESALHPTSRLTRIERRLLHGISMPVLAPVDILLGQALHAFKHLCLDFCRASHLLEFHRHVLVRRDHSSFWRELRLQTEHQPRARTALGLVTLLLTSIIGDFAPAALTRWTVEQLPAVAHLWVALYGHQVALGEPPGTKLRLLLQSTLNTQEPVAQTSAFPQRLPPSIIRAAQNESLPTRLARHRVQVRYLLSRLCFHSIEGLRYAYELPRWRRLVHRLPS